MDDQVDLDPTAQQRPVGGRGPSPAQVPAADAARRRLSELQDAPLDTHVDILDDVHRQLHGALTDLDDPR